MGTVEWVAVGLCGWVFTIVGACVLLSGARRANRACDAIQASEARERAILRAWRAPGWANVRALSPEEELEVIKMWPNAPHSDIDR